MEYIPVKKVKLIHNLFGGSKTYVPPKNRNTYVNQKTV